MSNTTSDDRLSLLREELNRVNRGILDLIERRIELVDAVRIYKTEHALPMFDPVRESKMFEELLKLGRNRGVLSEQEIRSAFRPIFKISLRHMEDAAQGELKISRHKGEPDRIFEIGGASIGGQSSGEMPAFIAGPCAIESEEQIENIARALASLGLKFIRGGAFKPRTSPYSFQGLGLSGLRMLADAARRYGLVTVSEITDPRQLDSMKGLTDIFQIGARNMANYALLQAVGSAGCPVILKRSFSATLDEFLNAAEYLAKYGAEKIILCERGIRTFERETRFTLDISAIPILRRKTALPVIADVSHAAGRKDLIAPLARAALAAGASGLMIEVHPCPEAALSDADQQLSVQEFRELLASLSPSDHRSRQPGEKAHVF